jgi:hypothetical protein
MELSKKLGFTYNWIKDKKDTLKEHPPQKKTFDDLFTRLLKKNRDSLEDSWTTIEYKFQDLYNNAFPSNQNLPLSSITDNNSIKRKFFNDIKTIIKSYFLGIRIFDTDISRIFFNRARALKDSHLKGNYQFRKLEISSLFGMIFKTRFLTVQKLINAVRDIREADELSLINLKNNIENFIIDFIFSNPFKEKYINDFHDIGTVYFKPEFDLTFNIWFEISKAKGKPQILKHVRKIVSFNSLGRLTRGYLYSWDGIMNMLKNSISLVSSKNYTNIFEKSWNYIEIRGLTPVLPRNYHPSWDVESTIKFHVIMLLIRDLGLDILTLEDIPPESFRKVHGMTSITFERHHIYKNNKQSIDVNRLVLVIHNNHHILEGQTQLILTLINHRRALTLDCPRYYKTNIKDWKIRWHDYIERRNYLLENGIESFIVNYFTDNQGNNHILDRFFKHVPKGHIEYDIKELMQDWIERGRPAPILNPYILNRLFLGTAYLINSGYIGN